MIASACGMARLNGSHRAAWNAMDLEIGTHVPPPTARGSGVEDGGALSARNVLLRQKLRERKRYDSADDAMKKAAARASLEPPKMVVQRHCSPAEVGQSAFFKAMDSVHGTKSTLTRNVHLNAPTGGAAQGRHVLLQHKIQHESVVDSLDAPIPSARGSHAAQAQRNDTGMEDGREAQGAKDEDTVSSPCASSAESVSRRQHVASMSPGRTGKYGALEHTKKLSRRDLLERQQDVASGRTAAATAAGADRKTAAVGKSDYEKLSAAHVLLRRKLKERKRFDSADYAMEKQGQPTDVPADLAASPAAPGTAASRFNNVGISQTTISHQVKHIKLSESPTGRMASPVGGHAAHAALAARAARYAGLKGSRNEQHHASQAAFVRYGLDKTPAPSNAAAARNVVLQRKLAERKIFDSADHFQKAA
ncbi:hypothetical protein PsorP6_017161 [Peronosclerospora sorghi]|uniref:Uncharacterized protein n=1 Tax=Peronosclerospora sorghi TaxID=230839 RepID=A0ACC0WCV4_9STRA|nr:hypothetical protein PsorP6_017161 [Peronosclerospora sorghi]